MWAAAAHATIPVFVQPGINSVVNLSTFQTASSYTSSSTSYSSSSSYYYCHYYSSTNPEISEVQSSIFISFNAPLYILSFA
jgi:hypothetical protein